MPERPNFAGVLEEHRLHRSMNICTGCNWRATPDWGSLTDQHDAHLAATLNAEVDRWLADEGTREVVAEDMSHAHWCNSNYAHGCDCHDHRSGEAAAALAALTTDTDPNGASE